LPSSERLPPDVPSNEEPLPPLPPLLPTWAAVR
jgi:hypothetical protein